MRLFVAVRPPDDVLDLLAALRRPERAGARWTTRDQWHVTLRFLGEVAAAEAVLDALTASRGAPACEAVMGPAVERLNPRIVSVPVAGLDAVAAAVVGATRSIGRPAERRPFRGHVTLARLHRVPAAVARGLVGEGVTAEWPVTEVHVVHSRLSPKGARYESIAVVPLANVG